MLKVLENFEITNEITPIHPVLCKLALMSKKIYDLQHLINYDYIYVKKTSGVTGIHCVSFFYYIGSIALILKKYYRAMHFFELAIVTPAKSIHAASIESYKKLVFLKLIVEGSEYHIPKRSKSIFKRDKKPFMRNLFKTCNFVC